MAKDMIESLQELIAIPSVTGTPEVFEALEQALDCCRSLGFRVKNVDGKLGYGEIGEGEDLMGILCHLDVVPAGEGWSYEPFAGTVTENGRIYGRGAVDDKGPAMAAVYAMKDVLDSGKKLNKRVRVIFGIMEEGGEWEDMDYYKAHEEIPSFGFTPDADFPAIYGEKGILQADLIMNAGEAGFAEIAGGDAPNMVAAWARGKLPDGTSFDEKGISAHGSTPEEGENAITRLMEKAAARGCRFAQVYMEKIGWCLDGSKFGIGISDEASGGLTFNAGRIVMEEDKVRLSVDIRYPVTFAEEDVVELLRREAAETGLSVEVVSALKPVYMDQTGPVISKLMEAYRQVTGDDTPAQLMGGGTYARAMDNVVAFGPVFPGRELTEHKADEWIRVEDLEKAREIYRLAIEKLACE